jgi:predicted glycoside hydrolase/deacetylase ChbG (UPF0249 family)
MPELIITADDCGLSEGINTATVELHQQGYITAASIMANFPAHRHAFELFRQHPTLEIGAHLTLSDGQPVTDDIPEYSPLTKTDNGFRNKFNLFSRLWIPSDETIVWIRHELNAQLKRFIDAKLPPQHITTHHHFHTIPALRKIVYELALRYKVKWVRAHEFRATIAPYNLIPYPQQLAGDFTFEVPSYISPMQSWMSRNVDLYAEKLLELEGTIEIVTHPSIAVDDTFPEDVEYGSALRYAEQEYLIRLVQQIKKASV